MDNQQELKIKIAQLEAKIKQLEEENKSLKAQINKKENDKGIYVNEENWNQVQNFMDWIEAKASPENKIEVKK